MKKIQQSNNRNRTAQRNFPLKNPYTNTQHFVDSFIKCHILYHMKIQAQVDKQIDESQLIKHVFTNVNIRQSEEQYVNEQKQSYKTLFNTMNKQDNSHSKEQQQYSKYLKQYQTMIKCSRKRQYTSPQHQNKEMNLLIHQFLSDIESPKEIEQTYHKIQKTATDKKNIQQKVKIQKINLNTFTINKVTKNEEVKGKGIKQKSKQKTPRFININDMNSKKTQKVAKDKQKLQIQVKVKKITNQPRNISPQIAKKYQKVQAPIMLQTFNPISQKQPNQDGYSSSYLKNKQMKDSHYSNKITLQPQKKVKNEKKPLKIQIQIPLQQLNLPQQPVPAQQVKLEALDSEREKIIKQISHTVFNLLHKTNRITNKPS